VKWHEIMDVICFMLRMYVLAKWKSWIEVRLCHDGYCILDLDSGVRPLLNNCLNMSAFRPLSCCKE